MTPNVFQIFVKRASEKNLSTWIFKRPLYNYVVKISLKRPQKNAIFGHFSKTCKKYFSCRREALFCVPLRKESHFFAISILCRRSETSQRNLTSFLGKSDFFDLFWIFSKIDLSTVFISLTKNAAKQF